MNGGNLGSAPLAPGADRFLPRRSLSLNLKFPGIDVLVIDFREKLLPDLGVFDVRFVNLVVVLKGRALDPEPLLRRPSNLGKFSEGLIQSLLRSLEPPFLARSRLGRRFA